ncbi:MAG: ABC-F family ATP-binding cassette domain-containing protein [Cucumibacter sp.]
MLTIDNLTFRIAGRPLFEGASVTVPTGSKTGVVGRNGSGKTTLFRLIQGEIGPDGGDISIHRRAKIGSVPQEAPASQDSVLEMVLKADRERTSLSEEAEIATDPHRIAEIHTRLADISSHTAEARASAILKGLGFDKHGQQARCSTLSGGWRMRVALAGLLFAEPDLLLLDEPTNYLDLEGAMWLEKYLATYPYTVLLVSHDRDLLNKAVTSIIHLDKGKLTFYRGPYDTFEATRRMQMELSNKARAKQLTQIAHMQKFVDRFRYKESKAKQAQARLKAIAKLKPPEALFDETVAPFSFPQPKQASAIPMLNFEDVSVGYDGRVVLSKITTRIDPDDRIALIGVNGNGKSTFAKLIAGELKPMSGKITRARKLDIAYFAQHQIEKLRPNETPLQHVEPLMPYASEAKRRARVAQMGLSTSRMGTIAANLSGGEKARLLFGLVTFGGPNMLILDEPTNHLDIDSRDALVAALNDFEGAVMVISHDRHLIEATVDQLWIAADGQIAEFEEDLDFYQKTLTGGSAGKAAKAPSGAAPSRPERQKGRRQGAARREETAHLRRAISQTEAMIERLNRDLKRVEEKLADPALYQGDPKEAVGLATERARLEHELAELESEWVKTNEALEAATRAQAAQ